MFQFVGINVRSRIHEFTKIQIIYNKIIRRLTVNILLIANWRASYRICVDR